MLDCGTCPAHFGRKTCCHHQNIPRLSWLKYYLSLISWYQEAKEPVPSPSPHHVDGSLHTKYFPHTEGQVLVQLHQRPQGWVAPHYSLPHLLLCRSGDSLRCWRRREPCLVSLSLGDRPGRGQGPQEGDREDWGPDAVQEETRNPPDPRDPPGSRPVNTRLQQNIFSKILLQDFQQRIHLRPHSYSDLWNLQSQDCQDFLRRIDNYYKPLYWYWRIPKYEANLRYNRLWLTRLRRRTHQIYDFIL